MSNGLAVILGDPDVRSVFVNVFGGITACDEVAKGIVAALDALGEAASKPIVVRLDGNAVAEGRAILAEANHPLVTLVTRGRRSGRGRSARRRCRPSGLSRTRS